MLLFPVGFAVTDATHPFGDINGAYRAGLTREALP